MVLVLVGAGGPGARLRSSGGGGRLNAANAPPVVVLDERVNVVEAAQARWLLVRRAASSRAKARR